MKKKKKAMKRPCLEGSEEAAAQHPFPPLTCREMSSTSHSSSHSWATADMATTVDTRMTTSPIWKGKSHQTRGSEQVCLDSQSVPKCV